MWSNNEDNVPLSNKPHDVMDLDALSENIISAEFPDDYEELFDANEFIDLKEGPDPEIGLNLQDRQA